LKVFGSLNHGHVITDFSPSISSCPLEFELCGRNKSTLTTLL